MKPVSVSEQLMFSTVRLERMDGSSGTGFFFNFIFDEKVVPVLITNKHVVNNNPKEVMKFQLHLCDIANPTSSLNESFTVTYQTDWIFHTKHDLCFTFVNPLFEEVHKRTGKLVFSIPITEDIIYDAKKLESLSALEQVVMVGYPNGLWDQIHNYPLFRRGYTSAHPAYDFNREDVGVVDMACFNGSSGSPIFILDESGYLDKYTKTFNIGGRIIFLGVLFEGPQKLEIGEIVNVDVKMQQKSVSVAKSLINLGYYIKSYELSEFRDYIKKILENGKRQ